MLAGRLGAAVRPSAKPAELRKTNMPDETNMPEPEPENLPMSRRGLFRLWAIVSVVWIVVVISSRPDTLLFMKLGLLPPVVLLVAGLMLHWTIKGFSLRHNRTTTRE